MSDLYWLNGAQMTRLPPYFPKSHDKPCVDHRRVLSGISFINRNGLPCRDAAKEYGQYKTLYNRQKRWREKGFCSGHVGFGGGTRRGKDVNDPFSSKLRFDEKGSGCYVFERHRTATGIGVTKTRRRRLIGWPISFFVTAGQVSDYIGARVLLSSLPSVGWLLGARRYDAH